MLYNVQRVCDLINASSFDELKHAYNSGLLDAVRWSWVTRKCPTYTLEQLYTLITGHHRPKCVICKSSLVSIFISFSEGFNKYCSKSCAKLDPAVEFKKKQKLNQRQNWKAIASAKMAKTNLRKYGGISPLSSDEIKRKRNVTNTERYGTPEVLSKKSTIRKQLTENIAVNKVFSRISTFENSIPLFTREEYQGADHSYDWKCIKCNTVFSAVLSDGNIPRCFRCFPRTSSVGELEVLNYIVDALPNTEIIHRFKINKQELDIYIPSLSLAIEFNGIYWHSEGRGADPMYHRAKLNFCAQHGIRLIQIWDSQWFSKQKIVKSIISHAIGFSGIIKYARKLKLVTLSNADAIEFLNIAHIAGSANGAKLSIGLMDEDTLVQVMTIGKSRFSKNADEMEIFRLASLPGYNIVGGASRLLSHAIKALNVKTMVSFCDRMLFTGRVYSQMGFHLVHDGTPGYWYIGKSGQLHHRSAYTKKRLLEMLALEASDNTEWELAQQLKLNRVWDCGHSKWKLDVVSSV